MGIGEYLRRQARDAGAGSLSARMRNRRFARFLRLLENLPRPARILDLGGTGSFWAARGLAGDPSVRVTTVNIDPEPREHENVEPVAGDVSSPLPFEDLSFDVVFSNSTIEHLFTRRAQEGMASEIRRLAPSYYVQTPNYWFPVEPHFLFPGWQWLPRALRVAILRRRRIGQRGPLPDPADARRSVEEIRLLRARELRELFPDGELLAERLGPLVKSWVVIRHRAEPGNGHPDPPVG